MIGDRRFSVKGRSQVSGAQEITMKIWQRCATGNTRGASHLVLVPSLWLCLQLRARSQSLAGNESWEALPPVDDSPLAPFG